MKNSYIKLAGALLMAFALSTSALATAITGTINFNGIATLDNPALNSATEVTAWSGFASGGNPQVTLRNGSFSTVGLGSAAIFTAPWTFVSGPQAALWSASGFTFDLTSSWIYAQSSNFLNVLGTGVVSGNGFDATSGSWSFTIPSAGDGTQFSFSSATSSIPDGGTTALLLGVSLVGVSFIARRRKTA